MRYIAVTNRDPKLVVRTKTADQIFETIIACCRRTSNSGH